jgi:hypothetical protein
MTQSDGHLKLYSDGGGVGGCEAKQFGDEEQRIRNNASRCYRGPQRRLEVIAVVLSAGVWIKFDVSRHACSETEWWSLEKRPHDNDTDRNGGEPVRSIKGEM